MRQHEPPEPDTFFLGLDLGQAKDFSALAALRRRRIPAPLPADPDAPLPRPEYAFTLRGLRRWPLGTMYTNIVRDVVDLVSRPPLIGCELAVDRTGCGSAVVDLLYESQPQAVLRPVLITAGFATSVVDNCWHIAKRELVAVLQLLLQSRRLEIPETISDRATLEKELLAFRAVITPKGTETFEADWRQRAHDDEVLAVAMAAWFGENIVAFETPPVLPDKRLHGSAAWRERAAEPGHRARRGLFGLGGGDRRGGMFWR